MIRLPCKNLQDFIYGLRHYYTVYEGNYQEGDTVILYDEHREEKFKVIFIIRQEGRAALGLVKENAE